MRYFTTLVILPFILLTQCISSRSQDKIQDLPNDALVEEVLTSVILVDSLFNAHLGNIRLSIPYVYFMPKRDKNSPYPPPPPPPPPMSYSFSFSHGFSFDEAFSYFNSVNETDRRLKNSVFITQQVDTTITHIISKNISSLFTNEKDDHYWLSLPIFSHDKRSAIIIYSEEHYLGYITVLKKVEGSWIKVFHDLRWMR